MPGRPRPLPCPSPINNTRSEHCFHLRSPCRTMKVASVASSSHRAQCRRPDRVLRGPWEPCRFGGRVHRSGNHSELSFLQRSTNIFFTNSNITFAQYFAKEKGRADPWGLQLLKKTSGKAAKYSGVVKIPNSPCQELFFVIRVRSSYGKCVPYGLCCRIPICFIRLRL